MKEPWFWRAEGAAARAVRTALFPAAMIYDAGQQLRWRFSSPIDSGVPVICVGNATTGGAGKTPFCLMLQKLLAAEGTDAVFLTRGYGGALKGPVRVAPHHSAADVGDEPLLLAAAAPTFVAKDRAAGAVAAAKAGASLLIMDDGFQNPTVRKAANCLLVSGDEEGLAPFPAGPLREPLSRALKRADAVISTARGGKRAGAAGIAAFHAHTEIIPSIGPQPVVAFCGIARPERFFGDLEKAGFTLAARRQFPDHHFFSERDMADLQARAATAKVALITTEKDLARLPAAHRDGIAVARLKLNLDNPDGLVRLLRDRIGR